MSNIVEINAGQSTEVAGVVIGVKSIAMHSEGDGPAVQRVTLDVQAAAKEAKQPTPTRTAQTTPVGKRQPSK